MFRPRIHAPMLRKLSSAMPLSTPVSPPAPPCMAWKARVGNTHSMISVPMTPSGFSRLWSGPAEKPSREPPNARTRSLDTPRSYHRRLLTASAGELPQPDEIAARIAHARNLDVALHGRRRHQLPARGAGARDRGIDVLDVEVADEALLDLRGTETDSPDQEALRIGE